MPQLLKPQTIPNYPKPPKTIQIIKVGSCVESVQLKRVESAASIPGPLSLFDRLDRVT